MDRLWRRWQDEEGPCFRGTSHRYRRCFLTGTFEARIGPPMDSSTTPSGLTRGSVVSPPRAASLRGPTKLDATREESSHYWPHVLPNGKALLFSSTTKRDDWERATVELQRLDNGVRQTLVRGGSFARYLPSGHILYAKQTTLFALPFRPRQSAGKRASRSSPGGCAISVHYGLFPISFLPNRHVGVSPRRSGNADSQLGHFRRTIRRISEACQLRSSGYLESLTRRQASGRGAQRQHLDSRLRLRPRFPPHLRRRWR